MSVFDHFQAMFNENSLDLVLDQQSLVEQQVDLLEHAIQTDQLKLNCVTYDRQWNQQEPILDASPLQDDNNIDEMVQARKKQQEKVKEFMSKVKPILIIDRKVSVDVSTEAGSPKKKKIRKASTYK